MEGIDYVTLPGIILAVTLGIITTLATLKGKRIDAEREAFTRAKEIYEAGIAELERRIEMLQRDLSKEQRVSLRLRQRIRSLEVFVSELRQTLVDAGIFDDETHS